MLLRLARFQRVVNSNIIAICAELLKRLREDDYPTRDPREHGKEWADHWIYMSKQDKQYLGLLLGKYLDHWWD